MTQEELDALPEDGGIGQRIEVRDGQEWRIPVMMPTVGALWAKDDEPTVVIDTYGQRWRVGWANGVRYKQRMI